MSLCVCVCVCMSVCVCCTLTTWKKKWGGMEGKRRARKRRAAWSSRFGSSPESSSCATSMDERRKRRRVRGAIDTLCELREVEAESRKCVSRADRSTNMAPALRRGEALRRRSGALGRALEELLAPEEGKGELRAKVERGFDRGRVATRVEGPDVEAEGVAVLAPGWRVATSRVRTWADADRVLRYVESRPGWEPVAASPHPAVPRFVKASQSCAALQNLPTWQSARITLAACVLSHGATGARELAAWMRKVKVHQPYAEALRMLHKGMRDARAQA